MQRLTAEEKRCHGLHSAVNPAVPSTKLNEREYRNLGFAVGAKPRKGTGRAVGHHDGHRPAGDLERAESLLSGGWRRVCVCKKWGGVDSYHVNIWFLEQSQAKLGQVDLEEAEGENLVAVRNDREVASIATSRRGAQRTEGW